MVAFITFGGGSLEEQLQKPFFSFLKEFPNVSSGLFVIGKLKK